MEKHRIKSILPKPSPELSSLSGDRMQGFSEESTKRYGSGREESDPKRHKSKGNGEKVVKNSGHRPVTSCTFCRQHKIKCNASENYPNPCQRCAKMDLKCEIDPQFRPKKGSQIQSLKNDVDELKAKIEMLTKNETLLTQALNQNHNISLGLLKQSQLPIDYEGIQSFRGSPIQRPYSEGLKFEISPMKRNSDNPKPYTNSENGLEERGVLNDAIAPTNASSFRPFLQPDSSDNSPSDAMHVASSVSGSELEQVNEFTLADVTLSLQKANELHDTFVQKYLPFLPIISSNSAIELHHRSQLLFWTVMLIAALSEPEPSLYMKLAALIKQLAIETCWIKTPRSTHVIQALVLLSTWPLPNEKVLDDCSYRFIGLARNLSLQLGLHRGGEFIQEFTRTQTSLGPNAELWRTRTWLAVFFSEHFWSSVLGLPPQINTTDYLIEAARIDQSLPKDFRCLISLSIFQCKLVNVMGVSVTSPDGLLEPLNRAASLNILDRELERLKFKLAIESGTTVEVYYLYVKLMICCFAFLPGTPIEDQVKYVSSGYMAATRIITITSQVISSNTIMLIELPVYVRHAITYSVLLLFKLHLSRYLLDKYVDSARQLIVTVHRLLRNTLSSWKDLQNDISRTAKVLENLNIVLYSSPDVFDDSDDLDGSIITRMRSHLTASLFYDLVWCIHEARRRKQVKHNEANNNQLGSTAIIHKEDEEEEEKEQKTRCRLVPLPFYNQITKDDFKTITTTTPNGTTVTTLVPTDHALSQAKVNANANGKDKPLQINGIPLAMLEATGSTKDIEGFCAPSKQSVSRDKESGQNSSLQNTHGAALESLMMSSASSPQVQSGVLTQSESIVSNVESQEPSGVPLPYEINQNTSPAFMVADQMDNFFQQQSNGWLNNNYQDDDFLGWFDTNMMTDT